MLCDDILKHLVIESKAFIISIRSPPPWLQTLSDFIPYQSYHMSVYLLGMTTGVNRLS